MRRSDLEHTIRAATEIIQARAIIVIGSQAILGSFTENELPDEATASVEVDMAPMNDDDAGALATALDGAIGELSQFHETHGYYVQGVGRETAVLPQGWEDRLVPVANANTNGRTGLCLDPHDLCLAKLAAARQKDYTFVGSLIEAGLVDPAVMSARVQDMTTADPRTHVSIRAFLDGQTRTNLATGPPWTQNDVAKPKLAPPGQNRVPPGVPFGGRFAAKEHAESDVTLE